MTTARFKKEKIDNRIDPTLSMKQEIQTELEKRFPSGKKSTIGETTRFKMSDGSCRWAGVN